MIAHRLIRGSGLRCVSVVVQELFLVRKGRKREILKGKEGHNFFRTFRSYFRSCPPVVPVHPSWMDRGNGNTTPPLPSSHQNTQEQIDTLKSLLARSSSQLQKTKAKLTQSSVNNNQLRDRVENLENEVDLYREAVGNSNSSSSMRTSDLSQQLSQQPSVAAEDADKAPTRHLHKLTCEMKQTFN